MIFMDIGLPGVDGIEVMRGVKSFSHAKIIVISSHDNEEDVLAALAAGADSYCLKAVTESQLADAVRCSMEGAVWLDPGIAAHVVNAVKRAGQGAMKESEEAGETQRNFNLSKREKQILALVVQGLTNQQIADELFLSVETIKTNMRHILEKLQVPDRMQAALKAVGYGMVPAAARAIPKVAVKASTNRED